MNHALLAPLLIDKLLHNATALYSIYSVQLKLYRESGRFCIEYVDLGKTRGRMHWTVSAEDCFIKMPAATFNFIINSNISIKANERLVKNVNENLQNTPAIDQTKTR